jgi:hypothetical protein
MIAQKEPNEPEDGALKALGIEHLKPKRLGSAADEVSAKYERIAKAHEANRKRNEEKRAAEERRFQAEMALPVPEVPVEHIKIRAGDVMFDRRYQTDERFDRGRAKRMARTYDEALCKEIDINIRPGDPTETPWCIDGRHRNEATIMRRGEDFMMSARLTRQSFEWECLQFAKQHDNVKAVPYALRFNAEVNGGDEQALAADALAKRLGLALGRQARQSTVATTTFLECIRIKGMEATEEGLGYLLSAWHGAADSLDAHIVKGVVWFVARRRDEDNYDGRRVRTILQRMDVAFFEHEATRFPGGTRHQAIAAAIVAEYNHNRKTTQTLTPWNMRSDK